MNLLKKIERLKHSVDKFEQLTDDLNDSSLSKQKKIDHLKEQIQDKVEKIDKIIKNYNADA